MRKYYVGFALGLCCHFSVLANAGTINVTLNTSALVADAADQPFSLEFELDNGFLLASNMPGGPHTSPSNIVTLSNFSLVGVPA